MNDFNHAVKRLVGKSYPKAVYGGISDSTLSRRIKSGDIPPPDIPATCNGAANKWLQSTIDDDLNNKLEEVA